MERGQCGDERPTGPDSVGAKNGIRRPNRAPQRQREATVHPHINEEGEPVSGTPLSRAGGTQAPGCSRAYNKALLLSARGMLVPVLGRQTMPDRPLQLYSLGTSLPSYKTMKMEDVRKLASDNTNSHSHGEPSECRRSPGMCEGRSGGSLRRSPWGLSRHGATALPRARLSSSQAAARSHQP
ncbi:hypothetical protein SKAU_G00108260 [Synaphobranchus kaupii]|uniref:Uncharacterized protein n=1 Tax=Synaphobranchus kaupii TaxID=118154 RepID=A0A9Q1G0P7_SYNKA|nr:hypothetical protein SKAU_G00108260 [Synaphobranchus kaupii]